MVIGHLIKREGVDGEGDAVKLAAKNTAQWSRNQKILQKETKQTKTGEDFAKNAEFLEIALQGGVGPPVAVGDDQFGLGW